MRIWFNHWFSTAYHLIRLMRAGVSEPFFVLGSNRNPLALYREVCDEWHVEPNCTDDDEYAAFCLDFCREHEVEIFVPRHRLIALAERQEQFTRQGVRLLCGENTALLRTLDDKARTYSLFEQWGFKCVPEHRVIRSVDKFRQACEDLRSRYGRICYKLAKDEGASTFRVLDETFDQAGALFRVPGAKIALVTAERILTAYDFAVPVLVMPWLTGPEISVDCLATKQGPLILPRYKSDHRYETIRFDGALMTLCQQILEHLRLNAPLNLQFRLHEGKLFLLEINPRMSGGLQLACTATAINVPALALKQLLGMETSWSYPGWQERHVAHLEMPICLGTGEGDFP